MFNGPTLNAGTYWLNLQNAVSADGNPVYWDSNDGAGCHSLGCPSEAVDSSVGTIPSEAFTILGSQSGTGTTPEPIQSCAIFASGSALGVVRMDSSIWSIRLGWAATSLADPASYRCRETPIAQVTAQGGDSVGSDW